MKKIEAYLHALQLGKHNEKLVNSTIERLKRCELKELSSRRILVATIYCRLLQYCQDLYPVNVPDSIVEKLLEAFDNIESISVEAEPQELEDSSLITVWFLHELKNHRGLGDVWTIDDDRLRQSIEILLKELDNIHFIFEVKMDGHFVFPINDMIAKVVAKPEFISSGTPLSTYHIHILQLAVKLFEHNEDAQAILQKLLKECNLKFINYFYSHCRILDTLNLLNYQKNGVMIFFRPDSNTVLIRHESEEYFKSEPVWKPGEICVQEEKDYYGKSIGAFIEYELEQGDCLTDFSRILENEDDREEFLKLIFDEGCFNILVEGMIIKKADGSYLPVNPFCRNDEMIIKGQQNDRNGKCYERDSLPDAMRRYRNAAIRISQNYVMNRVSFGLAILLLKKENTGVASLGLNEFSEDCWYQSQMIRNWVEHCENKLDALNFVTEQWYRETEYFRNRTNTKRRMKEQNIEEHLIDVLDIYPLQSDLSWMYQTMDCETPEYWCVLSGRMVEDEDGEYLLLVGWHQNLYAAKLWEIDDTFFEIKAEVLGDPDGVIGDEWDVGQEYYFLYDIANRKGKIYNQALLKGIWGIQQLQMSNHLSWETAGKISKMHYKDIFSMMQLQEAALSETGNRFFCDFDSQVFYRLIHNLLWSNINEETIDNYLRIFMHHQQLDFSDIREDETFMREDAATLYVPKDGRQSDSVLSSVYETYLKAKCSREVNDLYDEALELREDGYYYHKDNRIEHIVFLCDNFEHGTAARRMLTAYLDLIVPGDSKEAEKERSWISSAKMREQQYYLSTRSSSDDSADSSDGIQKIRTVVPLKEVVDKNNCTVKVHSYYGTSEGSRQIDTFLEEQGIKFVPTSFTREITKKAIQIQDDVKKVWPGIKCGDYYTVIREFNMTKANVFPEEMLNDPQKSICMFVKKRELPIASGS